MADKTSRELIGVAPLFFVRDVVAATDYYVQKLGFTQPELWGEPPCFAMPRRDGIIVMLKTADDPSMIRTNNPEPSPCGGPWDAYFWVRDARALFEQVESDGANVAYPPTLQSEYNNWEFAVRDVDGRLLAFGSDAGGD
ncbi:MAG: bleomycin resistance protein [Phycisphaeraceae bacterium]|nr:bleomycin resistance protein [Phycisphaeraceae bacterium]